MNISSTSYKDRVPGVRMVELINRGEEVVAELESRYKYVNEWLEAVRLQGLFELLVETVLSQNTNWKNTRAAYQSLKRSFSIRPQVLASADVKEVGEAIRVAGLHRVRSRKIVEASRYILQRFDGRLSNLATKNKEEIRSELLNIPGVGNKTADILLVFGFGKPAFPVDTHISRITKRLGIVEKKSYYEDIRCAWERIVPEEKLGFVHLALISFGREVCKSRKPMCSQCPFNSWCPSAYTF